MEAKKINDIYLLLFAGTLLLLLLAAAIVFFIYIYRKRFARQQQAVREMQNRIQLDILQNNIDLLETERKRFAEDLHDDIGSKLAALRLNLSQLQQKKGDLEIADILMKRSKEIIDAVVGNVRRISHNLLPPSLEIMGLTEAVEELGSWISTSSSLTVETTCRLQGVVFEKNKELALYRIIQELMSNTIRHAQAGNIQLSIAVSGSRCVLLYADDGKGLEAVQQRVPAGIGFKNINDRVNVLKGKLRYPPVEKGFSCEISFPVN